MVKLRNIGKFKATLALGEIVDGRNLQLCAAYYRGNLQMKRHFCRITEIPVSCQTRKIGKVSNSP